MSTKRRANAALYNRFSRLGDRDESKLRTLDAQEDRGHAVCDQYGLTVAGVFEDRGKSGGTLKRPGLQDALAMIERGEASVLVSARLSRLARSVVGLREIIERVEAAGGSIILGDLGMIDTKTATGKLIRDILAVLAEFELELAREHGTDARKAAIEQGIPVMGRAPWGYVRPEVFLEPDPTRGPVVTEVFARRAAGATWRELSDYIEAETGDWISPRTLSRMVTNPTYLGSVRSGVFVNTDAHPPLTDQATFDAAQTTRRLNSKRKHGSLLAGLLTCSGCGNPMTFRRMIRKRGQVEPYPVYECQRVSADGRCPLPVQVSARQADEAITAAFLANAGGLEGGGDPADVQELRLAEQTLADAERELREWLALDLAAIVDAGAFKKALADRQDRVDQARDQLTQLRQENRLTALKVTAADGWAEMGTEERRQLLAAALGSAVIHRSAGRDPGFMGRAEVDWL